MRAYHVVAIGILLLIGFGATVLFFPGLAAEARLNHIKQDHLQMHRDHPNTTGLREVPASCPAAATMWCRQGMGGLPE